MRRAIFSLSLILLVVGAVFGQFATNFTANDCKGTPYDLFSELDSGKVIVLCWVMPCGGCITPATTAYTVAMSYAATHPGKVQMYVIDDFANISCSDLNNWCLVNGLDTTVRFSDKAINMNDYGSYGMPKTVVVGGAWRKVYFNQNNAVNAINIKAAIDLALTETSVANEMSDSPMVITLAPNPMQKYGSLEITLSQAETLNAVVVDISGKVMMQPMTGHFAAGTHRFDLEPGDLNPGLYFIRVQVGHGVQVKKFVIAP